MGYHWDINDINSWDIKISFEIHGNLRDLEIPLGNQWDIIGKRMGN